jgi:tRNA threonylcarbamoyladenosine biosynthesis protein TsaB
MPRTVNAGFCELAPVARAAFGDASGMPTLRQILSTHAPLLVLDAASTRVQVGWILQDGSAEWKTIEDEAGVAVFECAKELQKSPRTAGAFVYCEGPGSILGIRSVAAAIRAWTTIKPRPVFAYQSLALVAHNAADRDILVIADARRESWHCAQIGEPLKRVASPALSGRALITPDGFRHWSAVPEGTRVAPYVVADLLKESIDADLLRPVDRPDAFLHEAPSYATWEPHIHRAPRS